MLVQVEVDVATARPPRVHATVHTAVEVDVPDDSAVAFDYAVVEAHQIAAHMAMCHPHVVMVVGIRTADVTDL